MKYIHIYDSFLSVLPTSHLPPFLPTFFSWGGEKAFLVPTYITVDFQSLLFLLWYNFCTIKCTFNIAVICFAVWCEVGIVVTAVNLFFSILLIE